MFIARKRRLWLPSITLLALGVAALAAVVLLAGTARSHSGDVFSAFATVTPTIDGEMSSGEWDDADCQTNTVIADNDDLSELTICVKNDATNLYMAVVVTNQDYSDPSEPCYDFLNIDFDNGHDGSIDVGEDGLGLRFDNAFVVDAYNPIGIGGHSSADTTGGGTNDLVAAVTHSNPGANTIGTYTAEYEHPLDTTDDAHDFSLASGDTVGFAFQMSDGDPSPIDTPCVGPYGGFYWPSSAPTVAPGWADINIAATSTPTPIPPDLTGLTLTVDEAEIRAGAKAVPIADIPIESIPLLATALAGAPLSSIGIETSPLSSIPLSSIPLSSIDVAGTPLSSIPLSSIPLSSIGGWEAILAGTELQGVPLQTAILGDVLALQPPAPGLADITLADVDLASTSLRSLSVGALALGSIPLSSIGVDWCSLLAAEGVTPCPDLDRTTLLALDIQGVPLSSIPLSSIPLSSIPIDSSPLSSIPLSSIPLSSIPLSSIPLSSIPLSSIATSSSPLSSILLSSIDPPGAATDLCVYLDDFPGFTCADLGVSGSSTLQDVVLAILDSGTDLASSPLSSITLDAITTLVTSTPLSSIPLSSIPLSSIPLSSIPLSSIGVAGTPLSSIPLSSITLPPPPSEFTDWCAFLATFGADFECGGAYGLSASSQLYDLVQAIVSSPAYADLASSPLSSIPLSSIPLSSIPLSSIPLSSIPLSSIPLSSIPLSSIPLSSIAIAGTPLSSIPLSSIAVPEGSTDWCEFLATFGTDFECDGSLGLNPSSALHELILAVLDSPTYPVLASSPLSSIPLSSIPLSSIPLSSIPLSSIDISGTPLSSIPLSSIILPDTLPETITDWCDFLATFGTDFECGGSLGLSDSSPLEDLFAAILTAYPDVASSPLSSIPLSSIPLSSIPLISIPLSSIDVAGTPLSSIPLSSITLPEGFTDWCDFLASFGSGFECGGSLGLSDSSPLEDLFAAILTAYPDLASSPLSSIPLSSIPLSSIPLSSIPLSSIPLSSIAIQGTPLSSIPLSSIPLSSIDSIVDCGQPGVDCSPSSTQTLGDAEAAGAILEGATVQDIIDALGITDPNDVTFFLSFFFGDILLGDPEANLGDVTFGDILIALLLESDLPWEQLPLDEMEVQRFAGTGETLHYLLSFTNSGGPAADTVASVELPDGFLYRPGTSYLTTVVLDPEFPSSSMALIDDPAVDGSLLTWSLGTVDPNTFIQVDFEALAGLQLGIFSSSASVSAGSASATVDNQAPVRVVENFEPNDDSTADPPILEPDVLYVSHISSGEDIDFFRIAVPEEPGSRVAVLMARLGSDNDLVMYRPATVPVSATAIIPVLDEGLDANNTGNALAPETLEDISLESLPLSSISANRGTNDESMQAISMSESGFYTIQVSGYNGSSSPDPYVLRVKVTPPPEIPVCPPRTVGGTPGTLPTIPAEVNTLFIVNEQLLTDTYGASEAGQVMTALNTLAGRSDLGVIGAVFPVEAYTEVADVADAYDAWYDNPCSPLLANEVATAIASRINKIRADHPSVRYVVIVGSDEIVPMFRVPDLTQLSNESDYAADLAFTGGKNVLFASAVTEYVLTDDGYGDSDPVPWLDRQLYVPEIAVGRLVEKPTEIVAAVDTYIAFNGVLAPQTALTTGYEFLADGANAVGDALDARPGSVPATRLINETWERQNLIDAFTGATPPPDIASVNAHYNHFSALPAAGNTTGDESDVFTSADVDFDGNPETPGLPGRVIFSMGCHSGMSVPDVLIALPTEDQARRLLDWPQAYAQQGAVYAANTGFGYGDTEAVALSERLMTLFAERLDGSMTVGQALTFAKQEYFGSLGVYGVYDEKALVVATFYGLPMFQVGPAATPPTPPPPPPRAVDPSTGLEAASVHTEPDFTLESTDRGDYYRVDDKTQVTHYRPIQPRTQFDITQPDTTAHGAIITDLASVDQSPFDAVFSLPVIDLSENEPEAEFGDVVFPTALQNVTTFETPDGQRQRLVLVPGQYFRDSAGAGVQRRFTSVDALVYYSNSTDTMPPTMLRTDSTIEGSIASFKVEVTDDNPATVSRVLVLFNDGGGDWKSVDLVQTDGTDIWTGGAPIAGSQIQYFIQAVDSAGNVAVSTNKGDYFAGNPPPQPPADISATVSGNQQNGWFIEEPATVTFSSDPAGAAGEFSVDGAAFQPFVTPQDHDVTGEGVHTVDFRGPTGEPGAVIVPIDTNPPAITCPADLTLVTTDPGGIPISDPALAAFLTGASATDNVDPDAGITNDAPTDVFPVGITTAVTFTATDAAGHSSACQTSVTVLLDSDGDGIIDADDACPETPGLTERQGCIVGDESTVVLHIIDQAKSGACSDGEGACKSPVAGAEVKVFDRNKLNGLTLEDDTVLTKNPDGSLYDDIFESLAANDPETGALAALLGCLTDANGSCMAGEESVGDYLVIVKYLDADTGKTVYTGKPKSPEDFEDTDGDDAGDLATKDFQVIKVVKKNGSVQISGGSKTVVTGSYLGILYPEHAVWEDMAAGYVYPFIFTSDSDWEVDICAQVPEGYAIVGLYEEEGNLISDTSCAQTFVSGETRVVAFEVVEVGSPRPVLGALLTLSHEGKVTQVDIEVPGARTYVEADMQGSAQEVQAAQLTDASAGSGGASRIVWSLVAAALLPVTLLTGFAVWRRRRT